MTENKFSSSTFYNSILFIFIPLGLLILGAVLTKVYEPKFTWTIIILFSIPWSIHVCGWFLIHKDVETNIEPKIRKFEELKTPEEIEENEKYIDRKNGADMFCFFYNFTMLFSVVSYGFGWLMFIFDSAHPKIILKLTSILCFVFIIIQILSAAFIAYIIMGNRQEYKYKWISELKIGLAIFPFWRFTHFFAIFMSTTFLFGLAFAFHDLELRKTNEKKPALVMENIDSDEFPDEYEAKKSFSNNRENNFRNDARKNNSKLVCFYFEPGVANLEYEDKKDETTANIELTLGERKTNLIKTENDERMKNLIKHLIKIKEVNIGFPRITLIGRADDRQSGNVYPSNYDLSGARIRGVRNSITKKLYEENNGIWQDIDWIEVPLSNEYLDSIARIDERKKAGDRDDESNKTKEKTDDIKEKCTVLQNVKDSDRRIVEARITNVLYDENKNFMKALKSDFDNKFKDKPRLIDYIYFPISKGYGDMKPATSYAKFLDSLENFFEVFFLVCFLSALISYKYEIGKVK